MILIYTPELAFVKAAVMSLTDISSSQTMRGEAEAVVGRCGVRVKMTET